MPGVPEPSDIVGIGLAGGQGVRARPLTLKAPGYLRSKAAMSFLGRRLIRWVIQILSSEGIQRYYVIAHGKENRYQIKVMIGYGEAFGVEVMYSPVKFDPLSTGSADSTLRMLEYWDLTEHALVFPTDSIIDFDLAPMLKLHLDSGAVATIAAMTREPDEVAEKYGVMLADDEGRVTEFVEKPTLAELRAHFRAETDEEFRRLPLMTNAGFYLIDTARLREIATHPEIDELRRTRLDFGKDLLPWLVGNGYRVMVHPVRRIGDLGNVRDYIDTMVEALRGNFESVDRLLGPPIDPEQHVWIAPESLEMRDSTSGMTLAEKIAEGHVKIGPAVRIGRYCEIHPGVTIRESNLDDDIEVHRDTVIERSQIRDGAIIGPSARLYEAVVGSMSEIRSEPFNPTTIEGCVALGDEVTVYPGVHLADGVSVYPRLKLPSGIEIPPGVEVTGPADVLRYL
ncbi:MAG: nucleotidyltransferase [Actinomycetota bacterium]|nr:MAG: nucleotidyltransferase [Actinomycetota bacterium]